MSKLSQETLAILGATIALAALILTSFAGLRGELQRSAPRYERRCAMSGPKRARIGTLCGPRRVRIGRPCEPRRAPTASTSSATSFA